MATPDPAGGTQHTCAALRVWRELRLRHPEAFRSVPRGTAIATHLRATADPRSRDGAATLAPGFWVHVDAERVLARFAERHAAAPSASVPGAAAVACVRATVERLVRASSRCGGAVVTLGMPDHATRALDRASVRQRHGTAHVRPVLIDAEARALRQPVVDDPHFPVGDAWHAHRRTLAASRQINWYVFDRLARRAPPAPFRPDGDGNDSDDERDEAARYFERQFAEFYASAEAGNDSDGARQASPAARDADALSAPPPGDRHTLHDPATVRTVIVDGGVEWDDVYETARRPAYLAVEVVAWRPAGAQHASAVRTHARFAPSAAAGEGALAAARHVARHPERDHVVVATPGRADFAALGALLLTSAGRWDARARRLANRVVLYTWAAATGTDAPDGGGWERVCVDVNALYVSVTAAAASTSVPRPVAALCAWAVLGGATDYTDGALLPPPLLRLLWVGAGWCTSVCETPPPLRCAVNVDGAGLARLLAAAERDAARVDMYARHAAYAATHWLAVATGAAAVDGLATRAGTPTWGYAPVHGDMEHACAVHSHSRASDT